MVQAGELFGRTAEAAKRLRELEVMTPLVAQPATAEPLPSGWAVQLRDVRFTYPGADKPALDGVSLSLTEGARLALVGASGSGKSSLIKLLMRVYAAQSGDIRLGGSPVERHTAAQVRARVALVDQRAELLSTTIRANLWIADPDADEDALWAALEQAKAADFVRAMPDGLASWIGEDGALVSGGQARRLTLARAFLKNAPILLLDEPTEGLDAETEADFLDALDAWLDADPRRSVLMVTHRAALLERAREAMVLDQGRIVEAGPVDRLAGAGGAFDRIFPGFKRAA